MPLSELGLRDLRRWLVAARADLGEHAEALDALNVFPVPDSDTGTNLRLTVVDAARAVAGRNSTSLVEAVSGFAGASVRSARGNSGAILSQLVSGLAEVVQRRGDVPLDGPALAEGLKLGSELAESGVSRPVEGTVLTVARAAAEAAQASAHESLSAASNAAVAAARSALAATTDQLEALKGSGLVDAGAAGYVVLLEALDRIISQSPRSSGAGPARWGEMAARRRLTENQSEREPQSGTGAGISGPAYEVMYLLEDSSTDQVEVLRAELDGLGDSVVIAGTRAPWSVHVHTDEVGAALDAGAKAGRPHRFSITRFADQASSSAVLALVSGDGLAELARRRGAHVIRTESDPQPHLVKHSDPAVVLCDCVAAHRIATDAFGEQVPILGASPAEVVAALDVLDPTAAPAVLGERLREALADLRLHTVQAPVAVADAVEALSAGGLEAAELITVVLGSQIADPDEFGAALTNAVHEVAPQTEVVVVPGGGTTACSMAVE
ncbi:DAK2 domain-containing protein [Dermacoccaceae bacterium W4C1]